MPKDNENFIGFVIDASITGINNLIEMLYEIYDSQYKIILTSITVRELEKLQKRNNLDGKSARKILAMAAENTDNFKVVLIDERFDSNDDSIIKYCADNKEQVVLLTSDKSMAIKARMYSVQTQYFKHIDYEVVTLSLVERKEDKFQISIVQNNDIFVRVCSDGCEYNCGSMELNIGDHVFVSKRRPEYITFADYRIISLSEENNSELIYSMQIYDYSEIEHLKASYKSFLRAFKYRINS